MKILHLHLKKEFFNDIKNGNKPFEYRLKNDYWDKRLFYKDYDEIHFHCGYPKKGDTKKTIKRVYIGYRIEEIYHPHFGKGLHTVYAIYTGATL